MLHGPHSRIQRFKLANSMRAAGRQLLHTQKQKENLQATHHADTTFERMLSAPLDSTPMGYTRLLILWRSARPWAAPLRQNPSTHISLFNSPIRNLLDTSTVRTQHRATWFDH